MIPCRCAPNSQDDDYQMISWCVRRTNKMMIEWWCKCLTQEVMIAGRTHKMMIAWWCTLRTQKVMIAGRTHKMMIAWWCTCRTQKVMIARRTHKMRMSWWCVLRNNEMMCLSNYQDDYRMPNSQDDHIMMMCRSDSVELTRWTPSHAELHGSQTKILEVRTNRTERVFESLFRVVSTRFGIRKVEKCF